MTRLGLMSDLPIDSNQFGELETATLLQVLRDKKIDHLHIAGDISNDFRGTSLPFLERVRQNLPVSFNLGNHDMLDLSEKEIEEHDLQVQTFGQTHLVSLAGWYDYSFAPQLTEKEHLAKKKLYWFDRKLNRPSADPDITALALTRLDQILEELEGPIIVVMHFVPHEAFLVDHPYFHAFNGFLGSQRFHTLFAKHGVSQVFFGHLHRRYESKILDGVTYQARPLGYRREWRMIQDFYELHPEFADRNTYRLAKRYAAIKDEPLFQTYAKNQLYHELADCLMTVDIDESTC